MISVRLHHEFGLCISCTAFSVFGSEGNRFSWQSCVFGNHAVRQLRQETWRDHFIAFMPSLYFPVRFTEKRPLQTLACKGLKIHGGTCGDRTCDSLLKRRQYNAAICPQSSAIQSHFYLITFFAHLSWEPISTLDLYPFLYPFSLSPAPLSQIKLFHKSPLGKVSSRTFRGSFLAAGKNNGGSTPYTSRDMRNASSGKTECFYGMLAAA